MHNASDWLVKIGLIGWLLPFAWPWIKKFIISQIVGEFSSLVKDGLEAGDDDDDALLLSVVHWTNKKCVKLGADGAEKFKILASYLSGRVVFLKGHEALIAEVISDAFKAVAETAKKLEEKPPVAPPAPPAA